VDLPTGVSTVTVEATDVNSNTASQDYEVEVAAGSGQSLTYDANGNMLSDGAGQTYKWDAENRLIEIVERRAANGRTWEQRYFPEGFVDATDGDFYYTRDHLGSIREVVADDGLTVESQYDYGIWGEVERVAGTGIESTFRYTGHFYHESSELHLTWFRAYDAELGRWLSRDPIRELAGLNLYLYVRNEPIVFWDSFGLLIDQARYYHDTPPYVSPQMQDSYHAKWQLQQIDNVTECLADGAGEFANLLNNAIESDAGQASIEVVDALSTQYQRRPAGSTAVVVVVVSSVAGPAVGFGAGTATLISTGIGQFSKELSGAPSSIFRAMEEYLRDFVDDDC